jgi:hypothetical protein
MEGERVFDEREVVQAGCRAAGDKRLVYVVLTLDRQ